MNQLAALITFCYRLTPFYEIVECKYVDWIYVARVQKLTIVCAFGTEFGHFSSTKSSLGFCFFRFVPLDPFGLPSFFNEGSSAVLAFLLHRPSARVRQLEGSGEI